MSTIVYTVPGDSSMSLGMFYGMCTLIVVRSIGPRVIAENELGLATPAYINQQYSSLQNPTAYQKKKKKKGNKIDCHQLEIPQPHNPNQTRA